MQRGAKQCNSCKERERFISTTIQLITVIHSDRCLEFLY